MEDPFFALPSRNPPARLLKSWRQVSSPAVGPSTTGATSPRSPSSHQPPYSQLPKTFAQATRGNGGGPISPGDPNSSLFLDSFGPKAGSIHVADGKTTVSLSKSEVSEFASQFPFTLVGKFSFCSPRYGEIVKFFRSLKLAGRFSISVLDIKHIIIVLSTAEDYAKLRMRRKWMVYGFPMRTLNWSPEFNPSHEPSVAPVWVRLFGIPFFLFNRKFLTTVGESLGKPLKMDEATSRRSRIDFARICVELDLAKPRPEEIAINLDSVEIVVKVVYESLPSYCSYCNRIGHDQRVCYISGSAPKPAKRSFLSKPKQAEKVDKGKNIIDHIVSQHLEGNIAGPSGVKVDKGKNIIDPIVSQHLEGNIAGPSGVPYNEKPPASTPVQVSNQFNCLQGVEEDCETRVVGDGNGPVNETVTENASGFGVDKDHEVDNNMEDVRMNSVSVDSNAMSVNDSNDEVNSVCIITNRVWYHGLNRLSDEGSGVYDHAVFPIRPPSSNLSSSPAPSPAIQPLPTCCAQAPPFYPASKSSPPPSSDLSSSPARSPSIQPPPTRCAQGPPIYPASKSSPPPSSDLSSSPACSPSIQPTPIRCARAPPFYPASKSSPPPSGDLSSSPTPSPSTQPLPTRCARGPPIYPASKSSPSPSSDLSSSPTRSPSIQPLPTRCARAPSFYPASMSSPPPSSDLSSSPAPSPSTQPLPTRCAQGHPFYPASKSSPPPSSDLSSSPARSPSIQPLPTRCARAPPFYPASKSSPPPSSDLSSSPAPSPSAQPLPTRCAQGPPFYPASKSSRFHSPYHSPQIAAPLQILSS